MRLKKVEICGFKSFKERTCLTFDSGITAIVGPNGCGKSNIVDAIRWAMGEPSPKALRGQEMEDVIFHGADGSEPLGMAEVTLTFENTNGDVPSQFAGCSEIEVTRRLFRSGESEYSINRVPCRRKDIWELFMDTGLGSRSYAIVEQDKVSRLISSKPEERRVIVEEVAGISRYRNRREAAQKKIEATSQNLLRLRDIKSEVETQLRSLEKQAKRAIQYRELREELLRSERIVALGKWAALKKERDSLEERLAHLKERVRDSLGRVQEEEGELLKDQRRLNLLEAQLGKMGRIVAELEGQRTELDARVERETTEIRILKDGMGQLDEEIGRLEGKLQDVSQRLSGLLARRKELSSELSSKRENVSRLSELLRKEAEEERLLRAKVEQVRVELVEKLSERAKLKNAISSHSKRLEELEREKARLRQEGKELSSSTEELKEKVQRLHGEIARWDSEIRNLENAREKLEEKIHGRKSELMELESQLREGEDSAREIRSRLDALERLQKDLEGFSQGVRALREASLRGEISFKVRPPKVVAEVLHLAQGLETNIANVLGERLQWMILDGWEEAWDALEFVREKGLARVGFVIKEAPFEGGKKKGEGSGEATLGTFFQWDEGYEWLGRKLLGNVEEVRDIEEARRKIGEGCSSVLITPRAELIDPRGLGEGGEREAPFLAYMERKREIAALRERLEEVSQRVEDLEREKEALEEELGILFSERDELAEAARKAEIKIVESRKELQAAKEALASLLRTREAFIWRMEEQEREENRILEARKESSRSLEEIEAQIISLQDELGKAQKMLEEMEKSKEEIRTQLTNLEVHVASFDQRLKSLEREASELEKRGHEIQRELAQKKETKEKQAKRIEELESSLLEARRRLSQIIPKHRDIRGKLKEIRVEIDELRGRIRERERELQERRKALRMDESQLQETKLRHQEIALRMEHLLGELLGRLELKREEISSAPTESMEVDWQKEEARIQTLREEIQKFQDVNLGAVEQYEELKKRHDELTSQQEDLEKSIHDLKKAIQRIDRTSRRRFKEAFQRLDSEFRRVFPILFDGGEAHLELTEAEDVLQCGLEIVARPPGKRLQKISLLSGGEKALTAVALIFAMMMVKDTPFCLLDEVDAPLDDANIDRFTKMVKELSRRSQFILVTHSKKTMEMADTLYGVTMETPGISRTISVRLH
jgi:chromosome segregation protein